MEIYNDDCFNVFPKIKDKSIDLFILDLPYGQTACKWDSEIDLEKMWKAIKRIMKPSAVIVFFCTAKFGYTLIHSNPKWFRYDLVWEKSRKVGFLSANKMPLRKHELMYVFKKEGGTYNPQKTEGKPYNKTNTGNQFKAGAYGDIDRATFREGEQNRAINKGERHPHSILQFAEDHENIYIFKKEGGTYNPQKTEGKPYTHARKGKANCEVYDIKRIKGEYKGERHPTTILKFNNPSKSLHRTQKPTDLLEWLIKSYSNEGDTIMDFTMGSGSTGIACMNTKRKFIGIELDKDIFTIAKERFRENENCEKEEKEI